MENKPIHVLISAYACGPNWGSEIGMGWNWVIHLSSYCQLHVIVEAAFKEDIEEKLPHLGLVYTPQFYYNDIGEEARKLFWKQGSLMFYGHYKKWQQRTYNMALEIIKQEPIQLVHQLNMIGFREPGYLWKIKDLPFAWGPVGGFNQMPINYLLSNNLKNIAFYSIKNAINFYQKHFLRRVKQCAQRANILIAATKESKIELDRLSGKESYLMGETGCEPSSYTYAPKDPNQVTKIIWVGRLQAMKALPIALEALARIKSKVNFQLIIIGDGPDEQSCKQKASALGLNDHCVWLGRVPNEKVLDEMRSSNFFFFTSLKEGSPHVVSEALQNGLPVLCHDACGHGIMVNDSCGIKIPMINASTSIKLFSDQLLRLCNDHKLRETLSQGAVKRSEEMTWQSKAKEMTNLYRSVL